ncbi:MAG: ribbon-helix-helix protein, CopG family [Actinobacteria bacterium]|nr:ribbon-helix-helix protein, CopG family [Actinomycetota bacterium]
MKRTQIQLTEKQYKLLKNIAAQKNISMAEVIRNSIEYYTTAFSFIEPEKKYEKIKEIIGKFKSNKKDISINHDHYLGEEYKK